MYAVIKTGGKQYKITEGESFKVEKLAGDAGAAIILDQVLFIGGDGQPKIGKPTLDGATVEAEVVRQAKDRKILVYKKKRRKGYEKKFGHRQQYTELKVTKINA